MGLYGINCPDCGKPHTWFSGNADQRCEDCIKADYTEVVTFCHHCKAFNPSFVTECRECGEKVGVTLPKSIPIRSVTDEYLEMLNKWVLAWDEHEKTKFTADGSHFRADVKIKELHVETKNLIKGKL